MPEKNFMTIGTEVEGLIDKKAQVLKKISNELADGCVTRAKSGKINQNLNSDILKIIDSLPLEDQRDILLQLATNLSYQISGTKINNSDNDNRSRSRNDIFANRRF